MVQSKHMSIDRGTAKQPGRLSHAGGVVFRGSGRTAEILLVSAKLAPHDWVLPKGHIEHGESPEHCARREVQEEAGVDARPLEFLGYDSYTTALGKSVVAAFYLMQWVKFVPAIEERQICWLTVAEALELIPFGGTRRIIQAAGKRLTAGTD
jgi:8-oxo-dGTP pyrophosphatase MutT (NUDIX family)